MASKISSATAALFLAVNLLFAHLVAARNYDPSPSNNSTGLNLVADDHYDPTWSSGSSGSASSSGTTSTTCPRDALRLGVCANLLGLVNIIIGSPPTLPCCSLLGGLVDLEVAVCLCTAIRANVLGINLNVPLALSIILNACGRRVPDGFQCP